MAFGGWWVAFCFGAGDNPPELSCGAAALASLLELAQSDAALDALDKLLPPREG